MSGVIIVARRDADLAALEGRLRAAGYDPRPVEGLPRFFLVDDVAPDAFALPEDPDIETIDDQDSTIEPMDVQQFEVPAGLEGPWQIARMIRRRPPWNPDRVRLPLDTFFRSARTGEGVDCYILDAGIDTTHAEFSGRAAQPYNYVGGAGDGSGHGTSCASLAVGATVGLARASLLWSYKFHHSNTGAGATAVVTTIGQLLTHYNGRAGTNRPAVCSFSWGGFTSAIDAAISDMVDAGIVVCCPAGNEMSDLDSTTYRPAESDPDVIICGGLAMNDTPYYRGNFGTSWGASVDLLAPAQSCYIARRVEDGGAYRVGDGTSYATPLVAGAALCLLQGYARLSGRAQVQAVKQFLKNNATTGRRRTAYGMTLPDRIAYHNPDLPFETVSGLTAL